MKAVTGISCISIFVCFLWQQDCNAAPQKNILTDYTYKTFFFKQPVDHFGFSNNDTFDQKYLYADQFWKPEKRGPIFFYTGNEGTIEMFCNNTGFLWETAQEFNALVIFAEHRYYGASLPYGKLSYTNRTYLGYLSSEQALADFAELLHSLRRSIPNAKNVPVIAFGGSYGGMLASWMRIKYPHIIQGALAASAPIWQFTNITSCNVFNQIVTKDFALAHPECPKSVLKSWDVIDTLMKTDEGRNFLSKTLRLCSPLRPADAQPVKDWLNAMYGNLAMMNYPYESSFVMPLPGNPVKAFCKSLTDSSMESHKLMAALAEGINVYFNYTGTTTCFNISVQSTADLGNDGWNFQSCTEMVMPMCADGKTDMFYPYAWDFKAFSDGCYEQFKVRPREGQAEVIYGGRNITASSNIIFSNGNLDPWSGGGVLKSLSKTLVAIYIDGGAHHLDLRASHPKDPATVIKARNQEKALFRQWIKEYYGSL